ncbi:hypothetical protein A3D01_03710 [Candidatus Woesebacteria bacterium RIFCSPHIGHO2_02_FULL_39_13]|uniref:Uncharacterized protein n=1 Tax=Candidatus Woesebacteria bacterium RIFCSPHIGHO2_02_FULL_39_13 TaxID=1802505 RepID=A0A1F7Z3D9_9BACT|nr:MAG: hypothetical protein A3D01_03710 [Candidatus Woesebacteria bacterium RIFCSPHIGHO2_02_FULL_39_13]
MFQVLSKDRNLKSGQVLLSILISIAVFAILTRAIFTLVASSFDLVNFNRSRITARHLAQEKIELARNLPYDQIGTVGGIPNGILAEEENIQRNGLNFLVKTSIIFVDDDFDLTAPNDTDPEDYKRMRVEVSWEGLAASRKNPIVLITDITSQQASGSTTGGTLVILVFNANGKAVSQAEVTITAPSLTPPVNVTQTTGNDGKVTLPGAEPCNSCYQITVTKSGFSTDRTYSTSEVTNPIKPHASLLDGEVTQVSFQIDLVGIINIASVDSRENNFAVKGSVPFRLRGNKIIGTNTLGQYVYKLDTNYTTDSGGNFNLPNAEWDTYQVIMPTATSWDISGTEPLLPVSLIPGGTIDLTFAVEPHTSHSLLTIIREPSQSLIASASARLYDGVGFDQTLVSGESGNPDFGQAFFSNLGETTYQIEATASGYLNFNGNFDVTGYTVGEVVLTPE